MSKTEPVAAPSAAKPAAKPDAGAETTVPSPADVGATPDKPTATLRPKEIGGPKGPEPTRYGDWERDGRCVDF